MRKSRILAALLALAVCASLATAAVAAPTDIVDAKDDLAVVEITQTYNGTETDNVVHNYAINGSAVDLTYSASLYMTEEMATYLNARQGQLMNAKFNVHVAIDAEVLEFAETGSTLTVTFSSSFLKPWAVDAADIREYPGAFSDYKAGAYTSTFLGRDSSGIFTYEISVDKAWAQSYAETHGYIDVPMELIVYFDGTTAYGFEDLPASASGSKALFSSFTVSDWMKEITVKTAALKVKDSVADTVTGESDSWRYVYASGTVDGEFTYEKAHKIDTIGDYDYAFNTATVEFGNDFATDGDDAIEEWTSNRVQVLLARYSGAPSIDPNSPYLNTTEHFAYVIGYPDGLVHPEGKITRAEVATIFFRMLTDEARSQYWSKTNPYPDVAETAWYNNAISTLTNLGILGGYEDGTFRPQGNITRAEFATMAVRFFQHTEALKYGEDAFQDIDGHWANHYINLAYLLELVSGYPDGTFRPQNAITRAEAMTLVNNTLRRTPCADGVTAVEEHEDFIAWPDNANKGVWYYAAVQEATNSHDFTYYTGELAGKELWTDILPVRDWAAFEKAWADANSAVNPGEVVPN